MCAPWRKEVHVTIRRSLCSIIAVAAVLAGTAPAAGVAKEWTVVGCDRMGVAVLRGNTPLFILHNHLVGPGWKGGRLGNSAKARGDTRVYCEGDVGFYKQWWDKEPMPGLFDLRYELSQTGPSTVRRPDNADTADRLVEPIAATVELKRQGHAASLRWTTEDA